MPLNFITELFCEACSMNPFCHVAQEINMVTQRHYLKKKEWVHSSKAKFKSLYALQKGALKVYETDQNSHEVIHGFYFQNEIYGYEGIASGYYPFMAQALTDTILCEISYSSFLNLLQRKPALMDRVLFLFSQQLSLNSYLKVVSARERVLAFLSDLEKRLCQHNKNNGFKLPMPYSDIGEYLSLATETISRMISLLQKEGILSIEHKYISFLKKV